MTDDGKTLLTEELEAMTDEALEHRIRLELEKEVPDGNCVRQILRILRQRDAAKPRQIPPGMQEAWEACGEGPKPEERSGRRLLRLPVTKIVAMAAVLCLVLFAVPYAFGAKNIVQLIARWTDDTFQFLRPDESTAAQVEYVFRTDHPGLQETYDTVTALGVTAPVVPTWMPEGYELTELTLSEKYDGTKVCAKLENEQSYIVLYYYVFQKKDGHNTQVLKDVYDGEVQEINGVVHHYMNNSEMEAVAWINDGVECAISANLDRETIEEILYSIYLEG